ncbi:heterodisulfide reductase-related iron-sulfur binding cluster [Anaeroselena agilis]|uniref:(Fe-S)-binding protein n=1 Tax=Anaeroselena agilis TaxID=3063788 RepID=A0ABU3NSL8_9FIRM|nr:(Fe-S)-binding protein [Selenomonadales bacterium 4137-cl]
MENKVKELAERCIECGLCKGCCPLLAGMEESPGKAAARGATAEESFSCALCGCCEAVCPVGVSPKELFAAGRRAAIAAEDFRLDEYLYLLPDRDNNLMSVYRRFSGIDYGDIAVKGEASRCFFPGCTLMTYAPELTRAVFSRLQKDCGCDGMLTDCCGKPLTQMGLPQRAEAAAAKLVARLKAHAVREVIVACPGCYYELLPVLAAAGVTLKTVYEVLELPSVDGAGRICTVHDSCPDRREGVFGRQVRAALAKSGFQTVEMSHSGKKTICCGSGGMISSFRPDFTEEFVGRRLAEVRESKAEILANYCASCTAKFAAAADDVCVVHALSLLLGRDDDFTAAKKRMAAMLEGPEGDEIWARIMAD